MRLGVSGVERLEHFGDAQVEPPPVGGRDLLVQRVADQSVAEAKAAEGARKVLDDAGGDRLVENAEKPVDTRVVGRAFEGDEAELAPEDRSEGEHAPALAGEGSQPAADRLADGLRDRGPVRGLRSETPLERQQPDDLQDEEWVALGLGVQLGDQLLGRRRTHRQLRQLRDLAPVEPGEANAARDRQATEVGERGLVQLGPPGRGRGTCPRPERRCPRATTRHAATGAAKARPRRGGRPGRARAAAQRPLSSGTRPSSRRAGFARPPSRLPRARPGPERVRVAAERSGRRRPRTRPAAAARRPARPRARTPAAPASTASRQAPRRLPSSDRSGPERPVSSPGSPLRRRACSCRSRALPGAGTVGLGRRTSRRDRPTVRPARAHARRSPRRLPCAVPRSSGRPRARAPDPGGEWSGGARAAPGPARCPARGRASFWPPGTRRAPRPAGRPGRARASAAHGTAPAADARRRAPRAPRSASARRPSARSASIRSSRTASRRSWRRPISCRAKRVWATSARGGPRHSARASTSCRPPSPARRSKRSTSSSPGSTRIA